jgi:hypothetical protein
MYSLETEAESKSKFEKFNKKIKDLYNQYIKNNYTIMTDKLKNKFDELKRFINTIIRNLQNNIRTVYQRIPLIEKFNKDSYKSISTYINKQKKDKELLINNYLLFEKSKLNNADKQLLQKFEKYFKI